MTEVIRHRGPDAEGIWLSADTLVGLGHRRLSILDLSPTGAQPMVSPDGRHVLTFNGEIYNHGELRRILESTGFAFRGHSDTEVLLAAIAEWGVRRTLSKLVGMFAFAVWDDRAKVLTLAVDRLSEKPLYYGRLDGVFVFGSELTALRAHPRWRGAIDHDAVIEFLEQGYIAAPRSIYRGIAKLGPGSLLELPLTQSATPDPRPECYWRPAAAAGPSEWEKAGEADVIDELERRLLTAVELQMVADVPLGAFLSGGIDSSLVVGLMQSRSRRPIKTFAIGFEEQRYDESPHARRVAAHLGTEHSEAVMSELDVQTVVTRLGDVYQEPYADPSAVPVCFLAAFARQQVTVALSGDAGDELFLGYKTYQHVEKLWRMIAPAPLSLRRGAAMALRRVSSWLPLQGRRRRLAQLERILPAASPQQVHRLLTSSNIESYLAPALRGAAGSREPPPMRPLQQDWLTDLSVIDLSSYLPGDILVKLDRAAMAVGLETRVPLLDHRVIEFALALPARFKSRKGRGKWVLRQLLDRYVPRRLVDRPKMGFGAPIATWLRGPLRDWADATMDFESLRRYGLLDPEKVHRMWREHRSGVADHHPPLWNMLMLQNWLRVTGVGG